MTLSGTSLPHPQNNNMAFLRTITFALCAIPILCGSIIGSFLYPPTAVHAANFSGTLKAASIAPPNEANNLPLSASITQSVVSTAPFTVQFDASGSSDTAGTITEYRWNFGDGSTAAGVTATHQYLTVGTFTAELTLTDSNNNISIVRSEPIKNFTPYEDAEDSSIGRWTIYDNDPAGAVITNVFDSDKQSRVIQLSGSGTQNGYRLRLAGGSNWNDTMYSSIQFSMNYNAGFEIYVDIMTSAGQRYLYYLPRNTSALGTGNSIQHGLGTNLTDGTWHTITRNLKDDLLAAQPTNSLLAVNGFLIRGSGKIDDLILK